VKEESSVKKWHFWDLAQEYRKLLKDNTSAYGHREAVRAG